MVYVPKSRLQLVLRVLMPPEVSVLKSWMLRIEDSLGSCLQPERGPDTSLYIEDLVKSQNSSCPHSSITM